MVLYSFLNRKLLPVNPLNTMFMKHIFTLCILACVHVIGAQQLISEKTENWVNGAWEQYCRDVDYEYTQQQWTGRITTHVRHWTGVMFNSAKSEYSYRPDGQVHQRINAQWNSSVELWVTGRTTTYSYTSSGIPTGYTTTNADGTFYRKLEQFYNNNGTVNQVTLFEWNSANGEWVGAQQRSYIYNMAGILVQHTLFVGDGVSTAWWPAARTDFAYDEYGRLALVEYSSISNDEWHNDEQMINTYNADGLLETSTTLLWNENLLDFINNNQSVITYNSDASPQVSVLQSWDNLGQAWRNVSRVLYNYGASYLALNEQEEAEAIGIYPNPAQDVLHVSLGTTEPTALTVFDLQGKLLWSETAETDQQAIPVAQLPAGSYLLKIGSGAQQQVKQFVKN
jgi:hypothetical protein